MNIIQSDLLKAAEKSVITKEQANLLWQHLEGLRPEQPRFHALNVLYYFGGVLI